MDIPSRVRGTQDWFGEDQRYYTFLKKISRHIFRRSGFTRISTPMLERKDLIVRSSGEHTDVVSKELYDVIDKKGRELCLKPESTAGIMRAYLDQFHDDPQPVYLYYIEPHFRYDRPQKGRFRQFHQIGGEIIGEKDAILDAESIYFASEILDIAGLKGKYTIKINSLGSAKEREKYVEELHSFFQSKKHLLDETDLSRLEENPLRILDSKNPDIQEILPYAPKLSDCFKKDSKLYYQQTKEYLDTLGVEYEEDPTLVRGLDYYTDIVFEFVDNSGRSQDAFGGGGRYDDLATSLGSKKPVPAVGFALGVERIMDAMKDEGYSIYNKDSIDLYFIQIGDEAKKVALPLSIKAQEMGINTLSSFGTPSLRTQMKKASRIGSKYVAMIGIMEARNGVCQLKNMENGSQEEVKLENLLDTIVGYIGSENLDFYQPDKELIYTPPKPSTEDVETK